MYANRVAEGGVSSVVIWGACGTLKARVTMKGRKGMKRRWVGTSGLWSCALTARAGVDTVGQI